VDEDGRLSPVAVPLIMSHTEATNLVANKVSNSFIASRIVIPSQKEEKKEEIVFDD
jgi:hypothetical protein